MIYRDLHVILDRLEELGELHRLTVEVDPLLEIAEITDRVCKSGGKALLFERVKGSGIPVVTNLFGSQRRIAEALGVDDCLILGERLAGLLDEIPAGTVRDRMAELPEHPAFGSCQPVVVSSAPCQEIVEDDPDLSRYPFLKGCPGDGLPDHDGRFITLPLVFTRDPETGLPNCGMYRVALYDARRAGIHWHSGKGGERHYRKYAARGERMPVAVAVGGEAAVILAATLPLPESLDEMMLAGFLRGAPVEMVKCLTCELLVPAYAEMVIEGYLEPEELERDGAFGNHTGFYAPPAEVPVLHVTCITRRHRCIYPATVVGRPPMEDCHLARAAWRFLLPLLQREIPAVVDLAFPHEWIFHQSGVLAVNTADGASVRDIVTKLWQGEWLHAARLLVMVDADLDLKDLSLVSWRVLNQVDWQRDLILSGDGVGTASDSGYPWGGSRLAIDATRKRSTVNGRTWPSEIGRDRSVGRLVDARWKEYGL